MRALRIRERLRAGLVRKRAILMRERVRIKLSMREVAADAGTDSVDADDAPDEESLAEE